MEDEEHGSESPRRPPHRSLRDSAPSPLSLAAWEGMERDACGSPLQWNTRDIETVNRWNRKHLPTASGAASIRQHVVSAEPSASSIYDATAIELRPSEQSRRELPAAGASSRTFSRGGRGRNGGR